MVHQRRFERGSGNFRLSPDFRHIAAFALTDAEDQKPTFARSSFFRAVPEELSAPPTEPAHGGDPARAFLLVSKGEPIKVLPYRSDPGEAQHAPLKSAQAVRAKVPAIKQHRHSHGHNDASREAVCLTLRQLWL
jgi:hypothetical protein